MNIFLTHSTPPGLTGVMKHHDGLSQPIIDKKSEDLDEIAMSAMLSAFIISGQLITLIS
jgi:hypothetical protein